MPEYLFYSLGPNTVQDYLIALVGFIASLLILKIFKFAILARLKSISKKTETQIDDLAVGIVDAVKWPFYFLISLYVALHFLTVPESVTHAVNLIILIVVVYYAVRSIQAVVKFSAERMQDKQGKGKVDTSAMNALTKVVNVVLWVIALLVILSNLGYNISTLLAGLGIGGLAIAFALQNVLSDIFASFSIYFDKPFQTGDYIIIGTDRGTVKKIGIKSTRIKTLQGQELIVSNKELTEARVNNYKKMEKRRILFGFGVLYETPTEKLKEIPKMIQDIFGKIKLVKLDRVHFKDFGDSSLNYEVVYYLDSSEYNKYMDIQQRINLAIKEQFEKEEIEFAYPTQTLYLNQ